MNAKEKEILNAVRDFVSSAKKLNQLWAETDGVGELMSVDEALQKDYPFTSCFNELTQDLVKWKISIEDYLSSVPFVHWYDSRTIMTKEAYRKIYGHDVEVEAPLVVVFAHGMVIEKLYNGAYRYSNGPWTHTNSELIELAKKLWNDFARAKINNL